MLSRIKRTRPLLIVGAALFLLSNQPCLAANTATELLSQWGITVDVLPSSPLYPVKLFWEDIQLIFSPPDSEKRALLLLSFCDRRLQEIYHQTSTDPQTDDLQLFESLKRYQSHYQRLRMIVSSLDVASQEITSLLENHQTEKDQQKSVEQRKLRQR